VRSPLSPSHNEGSPLTFLLSRPSYPLGIWSMIVSHLLEVCVILTLRFLLARENKKRDRIQSERAGGLEGRDLDATAFSDMTDRENLKYAFLTTRLIDCGFADASGFTVSGTSTSGSQTRNYVM